MPPPIDDPRVKNPQWGYEFYHNRPYSRFPHTSGVKALRKLGLTAAESLVAIVLLGHSFEGEVVLSNEKLAERSGVTVRLVQLTVKKLLKLGLVRHGVGRYSVIGLRDSVFAESGGEDGGESVYPFLIQEAALVCDRMGCSPLVAVQSVAQGTDLKVTLRVARTLADRIDRTTRGG